MIGRSAEKGFVVESWVMSCRAFSRRIEFHCLQYLFEKFAASQIIFDLRETGRNSPLMEFMQQLADGPVEANLQLSKSSFQRKVPKMPHHVEEVTVSE
jgi:predicted enzyme involved in methoxymalonyl-ACP biosynthesis